MTPWLNVRPLCPVDFSQPEKQAMTSNAAQFNALKEKFAGYGYRPADIKRVPQLPGQQQ